MSSLRATARRWTRSLPQSPTATQAVHPAPQTEIKRDAQTAANLPFTSWKPAASSRPTQASIIQDRNRPRMPVRQSDRGLGMLNNCISLVADNLVKPPANKTNNYWSLLSCLLKEQEDKDVEHASAKHLLSAVTDLQAPKWQNKKAEKWKRKLKNRSRILDTGCTSGTDAKHDADCFHDTGLPSEKVFMLLDKTKIKATNKMQLKHNLWPEAIKINIVPNLHSGLISVPKMADTDYIAVFDKTEAKIYNATTTIV
jgi:hypothetical protein